MRTYVYLVLTSQVQARSSITGNSVPAVDAQQVLKSTFKELINEDYSIAINIERYQGVLEHALSNVDFSVGTGIYMYDCLSLLVENKWHHYYSQSLADSLVLNSGHG